MAKQVYPTPFRPGDRVTLKYMDGNSPMVGTFDMYAPGQLSHCRVKWDSGKVERIKADRIRLVSRGTQ